MAGRKVCYTVVMPRMTPLADKIAFTSKAATSNSVREFLDAMGLRPAGGNYAAAYRWAAVHGITLPSGVGSTQTLKARNSRIVSDEHVFCENSSYLNGAGIKRRLKKRGIAWECVECGLGPTWNGRPLSLQLDHINGKHNDNRLENLRLLCPNCHSQTDTFGSRNFAL